MSWVYDEDIGRVTIKEFERVGIKGQHLEYELNYGGIDDKAVIQVAKKQRATIITYNIKDYWCIPVPNAIEN
jgi:hypothetical protein